MGSPLVAAGAFFLATFIAGYVRGFLHGSRWLDDVASGEHVSQSNDRITAVAFGRLDDSDGAP